MPRTHYVYLIKSGTGKRAPIKIGVAAEPEKRILDLQVGNPSLLTLISKIKASSRKNAEHIEYTLHRYFGYAHIRGEWFRGDKINLAKAFKCIGQGLVSEGVKTGIHGTKKDSKIQLLNAQNNTLKRAIEVSIDDELDKIALTHISIYR